MLTTQLRELESHRLVAWTAVPEVPPQVDHGRIEAARDLRHVLEAMRLSSEIHGEVLNPFDEEDEGKRAKAARRVDWAA